MTISFAIKYKNANPQNVNIDAYPSECGLCHKNVDPTLISGVFVKGDGQSTQMEAVFQCTNMNCNSMIIGYYEREAPTAPIFRLKRHAPIIPTQKEFNKEIAGVSPNFVEIYNQSFYAEQTGLGLISGIGYRKSLEFLIKDYLITLAGEDVEVILNMPLAQCINKLNNNNIKEIAKRATWIGNDEAHYVRRWEDKDINDLKKLIEVTVYFIAMDVASKKYLEEMS